MSALLVEQPRQPGRTRPSTKQPARTTTPRSRRGEGAAPKLRYVVGTLLGIFAILLGQLGLSIALGNGAYEIRDLERQLAERSRDLSIVNEEIGQMQDPHTLAQLAVSLGMVDAADPSYLRLSDASVLGSSDPATAGQTTLVSVVPGAESEIVQQTLHSVTSQDGVQGESLPAFAALSEDTGVVSDSRGNLTGAKALVPEPEPAATPSFGGDLPAPVTR